VARLGTDLMGPLHDKSRGAGVESSCLIAYLALESARTTSLIILQINEEKI
jgi:hypothetical protein